MGSTTEALLQESCRARDLQIPGQEMAEARPPSLQPWPLISPYATESPTAFKTVLWVPALVPPRLSAVTPDTDSATALICDFPASRTMSNKISLVYKLPSLRFVVVVVVVRASKMDEDG